MIGFATLLTYAMPPGRPFKNGELEELYMAHVPDLGGAMDAIAYQDCFNRYYSIWPQRIFKKT